MVFSSHVHQPPAKLESGGRPRPRTEQRRCVAAGSGTPGWERWNAELCFTPPAPRRSRQRLSEPHIHPSENTPLENTRRASGSKVWGVPPNFWPDGGAHDNIVFWFPARSRGGRREKEEGLKAVGGVSSPCRLLVRLLGLRWTGSPSPRRSCCSVFFGSLIQLSLPAGSWLQIVIDISKRPRVDERIR